MQRDTRGALVTGALIVGLAAVSGILRVSGQGHARDGDAAAMPCTAWGHPDLQGIWDSKTITPVQRPEKFAGREFLTGEEAAALEKHAAEHPGEAAKRVEAEAEALAQGVPPYMEDLVGSCLRPWTLELTLTKASEKANQIFETACHEGNYSLTSSLTGARALEREKEARRPSR